MRLALSLLMAAVMVEVSGEAVRLDDVEGSCGLRVRVFAVSGQCWGHCGQGSGPNTHIGKKAPGELRVVEAEILLMGWCTSKGWG